MNTAIPHPAAVSLRADYDSVPTRRSLLSRLRDAGDDASWRIFFDTYWRLIYNLARKSGLEDADAQDIVQETVISVARKMPAFRYDPAKGSFKKWLLLITRRRIQDHLRKLYSASTRSQSSNVAGGFAADAPSLTLPPDEQIVAAWESEWRDNLYQGALARVRQRANPKQYQVFDYCVLQNLRPAAVAEMLGMNVAQVYLAKHRLSVMVKKTAADLETEWGRTAAR